MKEEKSVTDLVKAALNPEKGEPLYRLNKGEEAGHPFRGNQHTTGESGGDDDDNDGSDGSPEAAAFKEHISSKVKESFPDKKVKVTFADEGETIHLKLGDKGFTMEVGSDDDNLIFEPDDGEGKSIVLPLPPYDGEE